MESEAPADDREELIQMARYDEEEDLRQMLKLHEGDVSFVNYQNEWGQSALQVFL